MTKENAIAELVHVALNDVEQGSSGLTVLDLNVIEAVIPFLGDRKGVYESYCQRVTRLLTCPMSPDVESAKRFILERIRVNDLYQRKLEKINYHS